MTAFYLSNKQNAWASELVSRHLGSPTSEICALSVTDCLLSFNKVDPPSSCFHIPSLFLHSKEQKDQEFIPLLHNSSTPALPSQQWSAQTRSRPCSPGRWSAPLRTRPHPSLPVLSQQEPSTPFGQTTLPVPFLSVPHGQRRSLLLSRRLDPLLSWSRLASSPQSQPPRDPQPPPLQQLQEQQLLRQ